MKDDQTTPDYAKLYPLLSSINGAADLRVLNDTQLEELTEEIRDRLINVTSVNGGHLGPNLGVVELSIALHLVFDTPQDQFSFDVSHQGYVHKLLTGRNGPEFDGIRTSSGLSGFLSRSESEHDAFGAGHAGTALSAALGMAAARDQLKSKDHVVAVCGDAAFTCGVTMEALNNVSSTTKRLVIILNDNEWSIAKNVGAISKYLNELITNPIYNRLHHDVGSLLKSVPGGDQLVKIGKTAEKGWKSMMVPSSLFEKYGVRYLGPIDGHDLPLVKRYLEFAKESHEPVIVHVVTKKGKGYKPAIERPESFHGTSPFEIKSGKAPSNSKASLPGYHEIFGKAMVQFAKANPKVIGITGAMPSGTGLIHLAKEVPEQFYDVGIAEEHAVLFAAGMATRGLRPVCAIYSTFLQRAFDQAIHDVCLQKLPVIFCMDRAGLSPNDGATHHGLFDIAYTRMIPNAIAIQPKDENELVDMMHTALSQNLPAFIRYPRGSGTGAKVAKKPTALPIGKSETIREGSDATIWALGNMVQDALALSDQLKAEDNLNVGVVNARYIKPLDTKALLETAKSTKLIVSMEDGVLTGGFGSLIAETLSDAQVFTPLHRIGWPDEFVSHGDGVSDLRARHGLSPESMIAGIREKIGITKSSTVA